MHLDVIKENMTWIANPARLPDYAALNNLAGKPDVITFSSMATLNVVVD